MQKTLSLLVWRERATGLQPFDAALNLCSFTFCTHKRSLHNLVSSVNGVERIFC